MCNEQKVRSSSGSRWRVLAVLLGLAACGGAPPAVEAPDGPGLDGPAPSEPAPGEAGEVGKADSTGRSRSLVLIGGGSVDATSEIFARIVKLAGGPGVARLGIITAGTVPESQDPKAGTAEAYNSMANGDYYVQLFAALGAAAEWIPIDLDSIASNASPRVVAQVQRMNGFVFGSGDQSRIASCLLLAGHQDSPVLAAIRARVAAGAVVAGTSAGTAIQAGPPMITGGESYDALLHGPHPAVSSAYPDDLSYDPLGGLGFFVDGLIDTHFAERGRHGRLARLAAEVGGPAPWVGVRIASDQLRDMPRTIWLGLPSAAGGIGCDPARPTQKKHCLPARHP